MCETTTQKLLMIMRIETIPTRGRSCFVAALLILASSGSTEAQTLSGTPLFTDNFTAGGNPDTRDVNFDLSGRQGGTEANQNWSVLSNVQVGNALTNVGQPAGTAGDYLLIAEGGEARLSDLTLSAVNVPGPVKINFDMFKGLVPSGDSTLWTSFTLRQSANGFPVVGSGEFGFLYRNNTGIQVFNNGVAIETFDSTSGGDSFAFYLADSAGAGSPFSENGTSVIVTQGGNVLGSYQLDTGMNARQIAFSTHGDMVGGVDNLGVTNFRTNPLLESTEVSLTASGPALTLDSVFQTVASLSGESGSQVNLGPLSKLTVNGSDSTTFNGVITGAFGRFEKAGSGTLTLTGENTYTGGTTVSGGALVVDGSILGNVDVLAGGTLAGEGTIGGDTLVLAGAFLNAGNTDDTTKTMTFEGDLKNLGTINLDLNGASFGEYDVLNGDGGIFTLGGTLVLNNITTSFALGDSLTIFSNWNAFVGMFDSITGTDLGNGLMWDTSRLATDGSLSVTAVPEPSSLALLGLMGGIGAYCHRRRKLQGGEVAKV
jgi:autotransporter-associated beta strand protein